jgi:glyoxylase-like metal-dependent hydrolase (beta-lactamase superfamily II)
VKKRILIRAGVVVLILAAGVGGVFYSAFAHNRPIVDGQQLADGVETVKDGFVSVFFVDVAPGKVGLIDAGRDESGKAILSALTRRGLSPSSVAAICLTHGHPDHTAACKLFPGAQVFALKDDVALIGDAAKVTNPLDDGSVSKVGDVAFEAFAVPGHTPGSAVYFARGVLFFGDSAGGGKDGAMMPAVRLFSKSSRQNVESLKALEARLTPRAGEVKTLAFAHSGPLDGFQPFAAFASTH